MTAPLREIRGPVGPLEALLDEPQPGLKPGPAADAPLDKAQPGLEPGPAADETTPGLKPGPSAQAGPGFSSGIKAEAGQSFSSGSKADAGPSFSSGIRAGAGPSFSSGIRAACVIAHAHPLYQGTMHMKAVYQASKALARIGVASLRFNFRGVGSSKGTHDGGPGEMDDYRAALDFMADRYPGAPLWAAGFSFGSWVAWNVGIDDPRVQLLLGIGLPVNRFDFSPVKESDKAKFLIHGERDELISAREIRKFYAELREPKELTVIEGADHLFDGKTSEVGEAVEDLLRDWEL